jgi:hypothetical protein
MLQPLFTGNNLQPLFTSGYLSTNANDWRTALSAGMQIEGLLRKDIGTGGDFCGLVVDLAVRVANNVVLASFNAAKQIGLESITLLHQDLILPADSACTVAHRGMQQLLEGEVASMDSFSTIDLSVFASHPSGTCLLHSHDICSAESCGLLCSCTVGYISCIHMQEIC